MLDADAEEPEAWAERDRLGPTSSDWRRDPTEVPPEWVWEEPVGEWLRRARETATMVKLAADLRDEVYVEIERWKQFQRYFDEPVEVAVANIDLGPVGRAPGVDWESLTELRRRRICLPQQRVAFATVLDQKLREEGVRIGFYWEPGRSGLDYSGDPGLSLAVSLSLATIIQSDRRVYRCSNCMRVYVPSRTPAVGRQNYCTRRECQESRKQRSREVRRARS